MVLFFFSLHLFRDAISLLIKTHSDLTLLINVKNKSKYSCKKLPVKDCLYSCFFILVAINQVHKKSQTVSRLRYNTESSCNRPFNDLLTHSFTHSFIHSSIRLLRRQ